MTRRRNPEQPPAERHGFDLPARTTRLEQLVGAQGAEIERVRQGFVALLRVVEQHAGRLDARDGAAPVVSENLECSQGLRESNFRPANYTDARGKSEPQVEPLLRLEPAAPEPAVERIPLEDAARRLGRAPATLRRWAAAGRLPGARVEPLDRGGRRWTVPASVVAELARDRERSLGRVSRVRVG